MKAKEKGEMESAMEQMHRARKALMAILLVVLHRLIGMAHPAPLDRHPVIRWDRRELHGEHLPEKNLQARQPQDPGFEQAPPVLAGLDDGGGWMNTMGFLQMRRPPISRIMDDWVPAPPMLTGLDDGWGWMNTVAAHYQMRRPAIPRIMHDWLPAPPA